MLFLLNKINGFQCPNRYTLNLDTKMNLPGVFALLS